jgi:hypothetical protein
MLSDFFFLYGDEIVEFGLELMDLVHLLGVVVLEFLVLLLLKLLQPLEFGIQLVVPGVEHHRLEHQRACSHYEACYGEVSRENSHN